jgi:uncharacterized protein (DUF736 family)
MASRQIGALWVRKSKDGKNYMSGTLEDLRGNIQIAVFKNDRKEKENQPDFRIVLSGEPENKPAANAADAIFGESAAMPAITEAAEPEIRIEDIPFS